MSEILPVFAKTSLGRSLSPDVTSPWSSGPKLLELTLTTIMRHISRNVLRHDLQPSRSHCFQLRLPAIPATSLAGRSFHASSPRSTDGVFRELTAARVHKPWIEAFRERESGAKQVAAPSEKPKVSKDRDQTPKRMSDSYHSVILPLAQDPWLLDTYLNSSGHIRLGTIFMDLDALSGVIA